VQHDDRQVQPAEFRLCDPGRNACPVFSRKVYDVGRPAALAKPAPAKVLAHSIYFAFGSSELDAEARAAVAALLPQARAGHHVLIEGRTDPRGSPRANARLAVARADAVRAALLAGGVPPERVAARAAEPCCDGPLPSTESDYAARRRAAVSISLTPLTGKDS
jgi:outer membrane protein OmpA-like peptidoglycan-associated protein